jgi:hypothetical protein
MSEWTGANSYAARVTNLTNGGGANGSTKLNSSTVANDAGAADKLNGNADTDLFFKSANDVLDAIAGDGQQVVTI